ncbi:LrgB family protein [Craterilacuibacter sp.]|uniref:LrgB family protein n=1 Tax=Craterilacuibacter sp. TaxID=2870909 RepID=UPI003F2FACCD
MMMGADVLSRIAVSPIAGIFMTLLAYKLAIVLNKRCHGHPLANTVLVGTLLVIALLLSSGISYDAYMEGGRFILLLLGPATVALAVPLYHNLPRLKRAAGPLAAALVVGSLAGIMSAWWMAQGLGLTRNVALSLMPRSVTTPIAMGVAEAIGGIPALTATFVIVSGILGAVLVKPLFSYLGWRDPVVLGFATGIAAHGIGTARVFQLSESAGAFAGLAMGLNGLLTAVLVPLIVHYLS